MRFVQGLMMTAAALLAGCATGTNQSVVDKVMTDFGLREPGEGYEQPSDTVFARLDQVGEVELRRLNTDARQGEVKFQDLGELRGRFYKEVKQYTGFVPLDAQKISRGARHNDAGYHGFIEYSYVVMQSERFETRAEAELASATVNTGVRGSEVYRYKFGRAGGWSGGKGELTNR